MSRLGELWKFRQRSLEKLFAEESTAALRVVPAWLPDETCPVPYDRVRRLQEDRAAFPGWHPRTT